MFFVLRISLLDFVIVAKDLGNLLVGIVVAAIVAQCFAFVELVVNFGLTGIGQGAAVGFAQRVGVE